MAVVNTLIGHIKGPKGDTGETGATGATGAAGADATVTVGSTTTVPYGQTARVTNTGTPGAAVLNFTIPQGKPGEQTTKIDNLTIDAITEPSTQFPVPAVGDNGSTLFGKISKWFSDMSALVAQKFNTSNVINNLTTTASGYALDARQGKVLNDRINGLDVIVTETSVGANITQAINPGGGKGWTGLGGSAITPTVPSGYTFAGNVNVTVNGAVAVYATFDGPNQYNSRSVNPYISNASQNVLSKDTFLNLRLYSLCYRK